MFLSKPLYWKIMHKQIFNSFYVSGYVLGNSSIEENKTDKSPVLWGLTFYVL